MANREEDLKKINVELEKLSDEELEQVAGGNYNQTADDSKFLSKYGLCPSYDFSDIAFSSDTSREEKVKAAWTSVGIDYQYNSGPGVFGKDNRYFIGNSRISREEAYQHVKNKLGSR